VSFRSEWRLTISPRPVRRSVDFDESQAAVDRFAVLDAPLARLLSLNYNWSGCVERYRIRLDRQSAIGQRVAEVSSQHPPIAWRFGHTCAVCIAGSA